MEPETLDFDFDGPRMQKALAELRMSNEDDPWLQRRRLGFGCSELSALYVALGIADGPVPDYTKRQARRLFSMKAGKAAPLPVGEAAAMGVQRERELVYRWARSQEGSDVLEPSSILHADTLPREWLPLVDRHCPHLVDTPDAWAHLGCGCGLVIQAKCSTSDVQTLPPHWRLQVQGEMAVTGTSYAALVCGVGWAATWWSEDGPIRTFWVERDEVEIERIRAAVIRGWLEVEKLRAA